MLTGEKHRELKRPTRRNSLKSKFNLLCFRNIESYQDKVFINSYLMYFRVKFWLLLLKEAEKKTSISTLKHRKIFFEVAANEIL